jgi:hypothetical protein
MKHGMMTVRASHEPVKGVGQKTMHDDPLPNEPTSGEQRTSKPPIDDDLKSVSNSVLAWMTLLSFVVFGFGLSIAVIFGGL